MKQFYKWLKDLLTGQPHFVIGGAENPYLFRWHLIPRNRFLCIYLHKFLRDDDDRALHDHPWNFISIILSGGYDEHTPDGVISRNAPSIAYRPAAHQHRVVLRSEHCWTVIFRGRIIREWGFWCPKGFVHWRIFTASDDKGAIGKGCGD